MNFKSHQIGIETQQESLCQQARLGFKSHQIGIETILSRKSFKSTCSFKSHQIGIETPFILSKDGVI